MLLWLQKNLPKPFQLWLKLCIFTASLHLIILFLLFFIYRGENSEISFDVHKSLLSSDTTVVFLPLYKSISNSLQNKRKSKSKSSSHVEPIQKPKAKPETKKSKEDAKADKATMLVEQQQEKKRVKKQTKKELAKKKDQKKLETQKKEFKKEDAPKIETAKIIEKEKAPVIEELEQKITSTAMQDVTEGADDVNVRYVGRDDLDALHMQEYISQELVNHWQPPIGVPKDRICELKVLIDWQGKVTDIRIQKPSGVLVYDMSARSAVLAMNFPKWLWGKEFTINFKQ